MIPASIREGRSAGVPAAAALQCDDRGPILPDPELSLATPRNGSGRCGRVEQNANPAANIIPQQTPGRTAAGKIRPERGGRQTSLNSLPGSVPGSNKKGMDAAQGVPVFNRRNNTLFCFFLSFCFFFSGRGPTRETEEDSPATWSATEMFLLFVRPFGAILRQRSLTVRTTRFWLLWVAGTPYSARRRQPGLISSAPRFDLAHSFHHGGEGRSRFPQQLSFK